MIIENPEIKKINRLMAMACFLIGSLAALTAYGAESSKIYGISLLFLCLGVLRIMRIEGLEFNFERQEYRLFKKSLFGVRGKWKDIKIWSSLVILSKRGKKDLSERGGFFPTPEITVLSKYHELYLMEPDHRKREFVVNLNNYDDVKTLADEIANKSDLKLETYNPKQMSSRRRR